MKLIELLEGTYVGTSGEYISKYDKAETAKVLEKVIQSPEYKELNRIAPQGSSPRQLNNGLLAFNYGDMFYDIDVHGNIRNRQKEPSSSWNDYGSRTRLKTIPADPDLYTRYINAINEVLDKIKKKDIRNEKTFDSYNTGLTTLTDIDMSKVTNSLRIGRNKLTSLEGAPTILKGTLNLYRNEEVLSLEGCPIRIGRDLILGGCNIDMSTIEKLPQTIGNLLDFSSSNITGLPGIGRKYVKQCKTIDLSGCIQLESHLLGLCLVKGLNDIPFDRYGSTQKTCEVLRRFNNFIKRKEDVLDVQEELIQAGYKEFAKL